MKNVEAVILSAGKGTRLNGGQPSLIPKAMFELNNKPMVWYIIQTLKNINIKKSKTNTEIAFPTGLSLKAINFFTAFSSR